MKPVGFDQKIQFQHLDFLANTLGTSQPTKLYEVLDDKLLGIIKGTMSRKHVITILMKIWVGVESEVEFIRDSIIKEYPYLSSDEKRCIHYCLACIAYPFYREQMNFLGKYLKMADTVKSKMLVSQMKSLYGDRRRVEVAASAVFSSSKDWGIINMVKPGVYSKTENKLIVTDKLVKNLLIEVLMEHLSTNTVSIEMVNASALFFAFDYHITVGDIDTKRFTIINNIRDTLIERNPQNPYSY